MHLDAGLQDYNLRTVANYARSVESAGCDCLWTSETQHDPFLPIGVAAAATSKLKFGTSIAVAFPRSPMVLAYTSWDLAQSSAGRFILGLGSQVRAHNQRRFSVKFEAPGPKLREVVLALRAIWDCWQNGKSLNFKGQFYQFDLMTPFFNPGPISHPKVPVYIAGVNHYMCRVAGEVCEGLHVHPLNTPRYLREYVHPAVNEGLAISGRAGQDFTYATAAFIITGETEQERTRNAEAARQQIAFYASTRTYEPVLAVHGWESVIPELHAKSLEGDWKGMARLITDEMLDAIAVSGPIESIGRKLRERYEGLLDRVALYTPWSPQWQPSMLRTVAEQLRATVKL